MNDKLSLEKGETSKLRELMQNTTPMKKDVFMPYAIGITCFIIGYIWRLYTMQPF